MAFGIRWLREPTYQERLDALDEQHKELRAGLMELMIQHANETDPEEWERVKREMRKKDAEIKQVQEEATRRYRTDPLYRRLEPLRQDIRRRLRW